MRFDSLDDWLTWQTSLHPKAIDLGLERVRIVAARLGLLQPEHFVVTVAGTNGKGSSVAMLEAMLLAAGKQVGAYTSPHIHRYNERIRVGGVDVPDEWIIDAFDHIERARGDISLSYFEFGTLAGLWVFSQQQLEIAILEVGLGGRLDAVNILDADLALITSIGIDHTEWLGEGRDRISLEKAGIARRDQPLVCSDPAPPKAMSDFLEELGSRYYQLGKDFDCSRFEDGWNWWFGDDYFETLPEPGLLGRHQYQNAAGVLALNQLLPESLRAPEAAVRAALPSVRLAGRYERRYFSSDQVDTEVVFDVAHNVDGVQVLVQALEEHKTTGKTYVLIGMMRDKDIEAMLVALAPAVDVWLVSAPKIKRAMEASELLHTLKKVVPEATGYGYPLVLDAWQAAQSMLTDKDRLVVTGSFYTVAEMRALIA
jgi:dihydrofolate synthase/folylpolyglutamate synthase